MPRLAALLVIVAACARLSAAAPAQTTESLGAAQDLYAAASYRDALAMLDTLRSRGSSGPDAIEIEKYRAFCLVALGRAGDAEESIVRILSAQPGFRLKEDEVSRRMFTVFEDTRRRALPQLAQQAYERGKQAYDWHDFPQATRAFALVVALANEPGSSDPRVMKDLKTLATGFLSLVAASTAPVQSTPLAVPVALAPATKSVYDSGDVAITPPVIVEQAIPPWPPALRAGGAAVVEVVVDEKGAVESVTLAPPFHSPYDELLVAAARKWRYRPALCAGQPVKFRRRVQVVAGSKPPAQPQDALHPAAR